MTTASTNMLQLPVAAGVSGGEYLWAVQGGTDKRVTAAQIAALATSGGRSAQPLIITENGEYEIPIGTLQLIIAKTDGADVVLPVLASQAEVGPIRIVAATGASDPFEVVTSDGSTIMGSLSAYPFNGEYQSVTFYPVVDLDTWTT